MAGRWSPRPVPLIATTLFLLALVLSASYWRNLVDEQESAVNASLAEMALSSRRASAAATVQIDTVLHSVDMALVDLRNDYLRHSRDIGQNAKRVLADHPNGIIGNILIINGRGRAVFSSDVEGRASTHRGQEYFRSHTEHRDDKAFISQPLPGPKAGEARVLVTRGVFRDRRLVGVVAIELRPTILSKVLTDMALAEEDMASVIRSDGSYIASTRGINRILDLRAPADRPFLLGSTLSQGSFRAKSIFNSRPVTAGWTRVPNWPLSVVVALDEESRLDRLLARDQTTRLRTLWSLAAMVLMAGGLAILLIGLDRRNRKLKDSERRFRQIFDSNVSVKLIIDPMDGRIVDANQAAADFYGYERDALLTMSIGDINCLPQDAVAEEMRSALRERRRYFNFSHRLASGEIRQVEVYSGPMDTPDGPQLYSIIHDVTERYLALQRLKDNEAFNQAILDGAAYSIICTDLDGVVTLFNHGAETLLGYQAEEVVGNYTVVHFHDISELTTYANDISRILGRQVEVGLDVLLAKARELEIPDQREWTYLCKDGHRVPVLLSITKLMDADGNHTGYVGIGQDITARRAAEQRLKASEQRLNLVLEGAGLGLWDWNLGNGQVIFNKRWAEMIGYHLNEIPPEISSWKRKIHPEDLPAVEQALEAHLRGESDQFTAIHRLLHKDQHWIWVLDAGRVTERSITGEPIRATGIHLDMTASKNAEDAVKASEAHLRTLIEAMDDLVFVVDTSGRLEDIHWPTPPAGVTWPDSSTWRGQEHDKCFPPGVANCVGNAIVELLHDGQPRHAEFSWTLAHGERHFLASFSALVRNSGWPTGFLCVARDVTELKELEAQLRIQALSDPLTGVGNRRQFYEQLNQELARVKRYGTDSTILMLDLDHFKEVNDRHGHSAGDRVLQQFCALIQSRLRASDSVGRVGGEEFAILLPGTDLAGALEFAENLRQRVASAHADPEVMLIPTTVSIGVSYLSPGDETSDEAVARADLALYRAKDQGRNRVESSTKPAG